MLFLVFLVVFLLCVFFSLRVLGWLFVFFVGVVNCWLLVFCLVLFYWLGYFIFEKMFVIFFVFIIVWFFSPKGKERLRSEH